MKKLILLILLGIIAVGCSKDNGGPTNLGDSSISSFSFTAAGNGSLSKTATGTIGELGNNHVIFITVEEGADLTSLRPSFTVARNTVVTYNGSPVTENSTPIDFSERVELTVTAENGSSRVYNVLCKHGREEVDKYVYNFMFQFDIPGVSVAVNKDEELVYSYGYGFADLEAKEKTTADHLFRLGSVSKQQTSLCIMTLVEEGRLNLSDHVFGEGGILEEEFGTEMAENAKKVTIQNLLEHTSGWTSDDVDPMFTSDSNYDGKPLEEIIAYVLANVKQTYYPGAEYSYYNLGFGMLGKVIEKVTGKDFESYLREDVLSKAGVTEIYVGGDRSHKRENECVYYSQDGMNGYGNDMEMIKAVNLKKYYVADTYEVRALDGVSLSAEDGEFLAIVGTSGSGKTTLLNLLGGLDVPDSGGVWIRGNSLKDMDKEERTIFRRRNIGFVFQQYNLVPVLSVYENIVLPLRLDGAEIDGKFLEEIVSLLGLKDKMGRLPETLSGGQQQRAAIARALLVKPAILLCDEPTGNLDSATSMEVTGLLKSCAQRFHQTVLVVTHQEEVAQMADRIIRLEDGRLSGQAGQISGKNGRICGENSGQSGTGSGKEQAL